MNIPLDRILPNPAQPRRTFDKDALAGLADSIRENGVLEPVIVEESAGGMYILHDGERRLRAAKIAGLAEISAVINPPMNGAGPETRLVHALVANIQRADLNPIEEALAYQVMVEELKMPVSTIARKLGISAARISQRLELLKLEKPIQKLVETGRISKDARLTRALLDIPDVSARQKTAQALADRSASIKASIEACERVTGMLAAAKYGKNELPALRMAAHKAGEVNRPMWDVFAAAGKVPPWLLVEISARNICDRCSLRELASPTTCRGCALVEMLVEMVGRTNTRTDHAAGGVKSGR